ncbi:acyl-CoA thioesterase [Phyllobacterium chamaecytisi]|uniref:acyl-CoA thioesterase n=1 Tax=Phyllobacterium chamaecytisi TaxID=2876082 RepID=UPI0040279992
MLRNLLNQLALEPIGEDAYRGQSQDLGWGRVYGGQILGQAIVAATNTVTDRAIHSLHAHFLRAGDTEAPIDYRVERVRDGTSFSTRRVVALQFDKPIFMLAASFQVREQGFEHQCQMPRVPGPENLHSEIETTRSMKDRTSKQSHENLPYDRPIEYRRVEPLVGMNPPKQPPVTHTWIKTVAEMPDDPTIHKCLLAYASDWGMVDTSLQPHGVNTNSKSLQESSLDHAMWFHRDFRIDEWLLYATDSPSASHARGFTRGNFFTRDGLLVASVAQEVLIRWRE